jgi:arginine decarboxylase
MKWSLDDSKLVYGVAQKDMKNLDITKDGKLELVLHDQRISFEEIIKQFKEKTKYGDSSFAIRIPQLITDQIKELISSFKEAIAKYDYKGIYYPIYPIKVNHSPFIIETIIKSHSNYGFESGTKSEFVLLQQVLKKEKHRLIMCNGAKDREYLKAIREAVENGHKVCISIESVQELKDTLDILPRENYQLAFRIKPYVTLHGHWGASSSRHSKFGLSIDELIEVIWLLSEEKANHLLTMLHAHPGSQITSLDDFVGFAKYMAKIFKLIYNYGMENLKIINFGGGLPIDYDNRLVEDFMEQYADIFVRILSKELEDYQPTIMTESGRAITSLCTIVVVKTIDKYSVFSSGFRNKTFLVHFSELTRKFKEPKSAKEVLKIWKKWETKKHDFYDLAEMGDYEFVTYEFKKQLREKFFSFSDYEKYLEEDWAKSLLKPEHTVQGNFSIFNSICDLVLVKQYFPVIPINNLHLQPESIVRLFDITCDSDGEVAVYNPPISDKKLQTKDYFQLTYQNPVTLGGFPVGETKSLADNYLIIALTGAYQDIVEFDHNLLGDLPDLLIALENDEWIIQLLNGAQTIGNILTDIGFESLDEDDPYYDFDD